jgi:hypothetical protein
LNQFALVERVQSGCWNWPFAKNGAGRAMFGCRSAPRQLYEEIIGPVPDHLGVLHTCDNPTCVNPDHWYLGDQKRNVQDCIDRGRWVQNSAPPGERHHNARLTSAQVLEIRAKAAAGVGCSVLGLEYGVSKQHASKIIKGQRWAA